MIFTRQQQAAIDTRNKDLLVSAGAGAGKTRVLVSRITDMLTDQDSPLSANEILVMTFTNAAARELKERLLLQLSEKLDQNPGDKRLRRQVRLMRQADVSTIHSFCSSVLRRHFQEAGIDPSFRIGEDGEMTLLRKQAMEILLEDYYDREEEDFLKIVEAFAPGRDDRILEDMITGLYDFSRGFPDPAAWFGHRLQEAEKLARPETAASSVLVAGLLKKTKDLTDQLSQDLRELETCVLKGQEEAVPERYDRLISEDRKVLEQLSGHLSYEEYHQVLKDMSVLDMPRGVSKTEKLFAGLGDIKSFHEKVKDILTGLRDQEYRLSLTEFCRENAVLLPFIRGLRDLVFSYQDLYGQLKKDQNVYDFDDLEHMTLDLLVKEYDQEGNPVPAETAAAIAGRYREIFVDEYQDTSLIQETILNTLKGAGGGHLFTVGDIKQSIYSFRQARPDLFLKRAESYHSPGAAAIELTDNFRSAPDVLALCNQVFSSLMDLDFGGLVYDEKHALRAGAHGPMEHAEDTSEILLLMEDQEKESISWEYDALTAETAMIARRIRQLVTEGYHYEDMVILLRSDSGRAETMADYLDQMGIPVECESKTGYFHSREVMIILNYLAVTDNVYQDIPMASVLLSPIGGLTEDDLARIRTQIEIPRRGDYSLYDLMNLYLEEGEDESLRARLSDFLSRLAVFRKQKKELPLHRLLWNIYQDTGFYYDVLLMSEGEKRRENLNMLLQKAEEYEKTVFKGLFYFIRYMDQLQSYEVELPEAGRGRQETRKVRIMTVHKSKGLEFPVVFVSNLSRQFNMTDTNRNILYHPDMGLGLEVVDLKNRIRHPSFMKKRIRERIVRENLEEELRILYVAMTRASRKLIMTGIVTEKMLEKAGNNPLHTRDKLTARSYMDWLLPLFLSEALDPYVRRIHLRQLDEMLIPVPADQNQDCFRDLMTGKADLPDPAPVEKAFSYEYPWKHLTSLKRKYSVSELKKLSMIAPAEEGDGFHDDDYDQEAGWQDEEIPVPRFLKEEVTMKATDRGTIVHKIMELLPFASVHKQEDLKAALTAIKEDYLPAGQIPMAQLYDGVEAFLFSEEGEKIRQMDAAGKLYKEAPFTISIPAFLTGKTRIEPAVSHNSREIAEAVSIDLESEEDVVVQGIIDAYGETEEGLWLIDYKTDRIEKGREQLLLDRYQMQMLYYKTALEMIVKKPVIRTLIYSFALRTFILVP